MTSFKTIIKQLLNVKNVVVEDIQLAEGSEQIKGLNIHLRPTKRYQYRCCCCQKVCPVYDGLTNSKKAMWRALDFGGCTVHLFSPTCRVNCPEHGVKTCYVPWAFPGSRFTRSFDFMAAWLAKDVSKSTIATLLRIDWKTVGRCVSRAKEFLDPDPQARFDGLKRIGIDETSYCTGHKYITTVVNHDTNTVVWAHEGHSSETLSKFFESLSPEQRSAIEVVTADGAKWIDSCIAKYIPETTRCMDSFHVVQWAMEAVDRVRLDLWREAKIKLHQLMKSSQKAKEDKTPSQKLKEQIAEQTKEVFKLKGSKIALGKDPNNLTTRQSTTLKNIEICNPKLFRAYSLKETLRLALKSSSVQQAGESLKEWLAWASRSKLEPMVELAKKIRRHHSSILNTIETGLSNGRIEALNNKIQLIIRKAFGFRNVQNLIDMVLLICSDLLIPLPNRICHLDKPKHSKSSQCI